MNRGVESFPILSRRRDGRLGVLSIGRLVLRFSPRLLFSRLRVKARIQQCDECLSSTPVCATRRVGNRARELLRVAARARARSREANTPRSVFVDLLLLFFFFFFGRSSPLLGPSRFSTHTVTFPPSLLPLLSFLFTISLFFTRTSLLHVPPLPHHLL